MSAELIVNADDFGKSEEVNQAILECFRQGIITRTTLMVNMPYALQAVELAKENGLLNRVGIHLNLTEGMPLTEAIKSNPLICDENGYFHAGFQKTTKYRLYMDNLTIHQVREELHAQLEKYQALGLTLMHVDSHHHVHTNYPILKALRPLARIYQFSSMRLGRNLYQGGNPFMRLYKLWYNHEVKKLCSATDYFGSYKDFLAMGNEMQSIINKSSVEIMVHPMYNDAHVLVDTDIPMENVKRTLGEYI